MSRPRTEDGGACTGHNAECLVRGYKVQRGHAVKEPETTWMGLSDMETPIAPRGSTSPGRSSSHSADAELPQTACPRKCFFLNSLHAASSGITTGPKIPLPLQLRPGAQSMSASDTKADARDRSIATDIVLSSTESFSTECPSLSTMLAVIGQIEVMRCFTAGTWVPRKAGRG
jgi:hypothetical protein